MISKKKIEEIVAESLADTEIVPVDIQVSSANTIKVFLDAEKGVSISDCVNISRSIEGQLDRDKEDFELEVSSYGLFSPFKLLLHYKKNLGREIEVYLNEGKNFKGVLSNFETDANNNLEYIEVIQKKKKKLEGKKKKIEVEEIIKVKKDEIKKVKLVPKF